MSPTFTTVLCANRGEIACRVFASARRQGYRTVAVYSDADAGARHVALADVATRIGPGPARDSYLSIEALLAAAARTGADAIHPGYGFLSENAEFARAVEQAGLVFIGPGAEAIRLMGNKSLAKRLMIEAGVPTIPGWQGASPDVGQDEPALEAAAAEVGYPLLIKAAAGGGGRGMRLVHAPAEFIQSLRTAKAEAMSAFGDNEVLLEHALLDARHVEIQVFADRHGNTIHLGERDCSIQRRHQKIVEESPSPAVDPGLRARMGAAAVAAARRIGYLGAGTVEFLLDGDGAFYFLEMNTRLQVEHPVTECLTGLDLVALQLDVAAGAPLPLSQDQVQLSGHAIEVRLYAEDPYGGFLPQTGDVLRWRPGVVESDAGTLGPARLVDGLRVDHGLIEGQPVSPFYDPMLAKLVAHGRDRDEARRRVLRLLEHTTLLGTTTNKTFLAEVLSHPAFVAGEATTRFIPTHFLPAGAESPARPAAPAWLLAVATALLSERDRAVFEPAIGGPASWSIRLSCDEAVRVAHVVAHGGARVDVSIDGESTRLQAVSRGEDEVRVLVDEVVRTVRFARDGRRVFLDSGRQSITVTELPSFEPRKTAAAGDGRVLAPMNGRVVSVHVEPGDRVARGQPLLAIEAMKMQNQICADVDGTVAEVNVAADDQVATRKLLVRITPDPQ